MAGSARNLIVLSDGTGTSASKASKTNVWRLFQALDLTERTQIAAVGDGVGTSSVKLLRILGLALGVGVKRDVLNLYKFLCRNYVSGDQIWAFGFSRGAFTIRVLVGLIAREGLVSWDTKAELDRNALAAYRAYRSKAFRSNLPWVLALRFIRGKWTSAWSAITAKRSYTAIQNETKALGRTGIKVHFVGVWDTVLPYALSIDELKQASDNWVWQQTIAYADLLRGDLTQIADKFVWPMAFRELNLLQNVENARHALSLDDDQLLISQVNR